MLKWKWRYKMYKKALVLLIGLFLMTSFLFSGGGIKKANNSQNRPEKLTTYEEPAAYISYIEGKASLNFEEAQINMILLPADELKTENGRLEIKMDQGYLRLDRYTEVVFVVIEEGMKTIRIKQGNIYIQTEEEIIIETPHQENSLSRGSYLIEVRNKTKIYSNPKVPFNDFLSWNFNRNDELNRRAKQRYLPEELSDYEYTLHRYGNWRYYSPYGYVWIPRVAYSWRPYLYGRWQWYPIVGWTWISYEPFGWVAFHYGRWQWHPVWGWYWTPTRFWGPAWVYWYSWSGYIGWCPMWYDSYYYQRYRSYYDYSYGRAWTFVRKNQLKNRNIAKSVIGQNELRRKVPKSITSQLRKNLDIPAVKVLKRSKIRTRGTIRTEKSKVVRRGRKKEGRKTVSKSRAKKHSRVNKNRKSSNRKASSKKSTSSKKSSSSKSKKGKIKKKRK